MRVKKNIFLIKSSCREYDYGVGSFLHNLIAGLKTKNYNIYILDASKKFDSLQIKQSNGISIIEIPFIISPTLFSKDNHALGNRGCDLIASILFNKLSDKDATVLFNSFHEYPLALALKKHLHAKILFVFHTATNQINLPFDISISSFVENLDFIVSPSNYCKDFVCSEFNIDKSRIKVIYNGIETYDNNSYNEKNCDLIRKKYDINSNEIVFLFAGRIDYQKGIKYLIEAFNLLRRDIPNSRLVIAGEGNVEYFLPFCYENYTHITFTGFIPRNELFYLYKICDIGVIPSLNENCSYVALEMMYFKLPVIVSQIGGFPEILISGETGIINPMCNNKENKWITPNVDSLKENMKLLIEDIPLREKIIQNAYRKVMTDLSNHEMAMNYINLIS